MDALTEPETTTKPEADASTNAVAASATGLKLDSLEIKGFRAFRHLTIERLARVNLIVGKNNVGKTSVLEALRLYAGDGDLSALKEILAARDEITFHTVKDVDGGQDQLPLRYAFFGRPRYYQETQSIDIGPVGSRWNTFSFSPVWLRKDSKTGELVSPETGIEELLETEVYLDVYTSNGIEYRTSLKGLMNQRWPYVGIPFVFVPALGMKRRDVGLLWDDIALTNLEDTVTESLHIIALDVRRVNFLGGMEVRIPAVRLAGQEDPVPMASLGEGMNRLFGVALALVNAKDGFLLVDEMESGIHYSVLPDLWRLVFRTAKALNVQVFATTHSWDCIQAFQIASAEDEAEGMLIRLENKDGDVKTTLYDERRLEIATREQIEVR